VIEVWPLDLTSTESTPAFANCVKKELPCVDILLEDAGINWTWFASKGFGDTIQVNTINTFLPTFSWLLKLWETKGAFADSLPRLVIVSSKDYRLTKFPEINSPDMYEIEWWKRLRWTKEVSLWLQTNHSGLLFLRLWRKSTTYISLREQVPNQQAHWSPLYPCLCLLPQHLLIRTTTSHQPHKPWLVFLESRPQLRPKPRVQNPPFPPTVNTHAHRRGRRSRSRAE
jgi:hypothetical protein